MKEIDKYNIIKSGNRYIVIDIETGEIFDNAQGYGFKTKQGAYKCLYYKLNKDKTEYKELKQKYETILKKYKFLDKINDNLCNELFYALKDGERMSQKEIDKFILKEIDEHIPELKIELNDDEKLKKYFLKQFPK